MKKVGLVLLVLLNVCSSIFAVDYTVSEVSGNVRLFLDKKDNWEKIVVGQTLNSDSFVNVSLNSTLTLLTDKGNKITINSLSKGKLSELISSSSVNGIKRATRLVATNIAPATNGTSKSVATAASRASEAKEDIDWQEE